MAKEGESKEYQLEASDVMVEKTERLCGNCEKRLSVEYTVSIDFRSAGEIVEIQKGLCNACARDLATRIQEGLPDA